MDEQTIELGSRPIPIWPRGQTVTALFGDIIWMTKFADADAYHTGLTAKILEEEVRQNSAEKRGMRIQGGSKIHYVDTWDCPEAALIDARARALYRRALKQDNAVVDLSWANIYRQWDYVMPHCHLRATASVVYVLDGGDEDPQDPSAGKFCFVDPRLEICCREQAEFMTTPWFPELVPGSMILFPSQVLHFVTAYKGERPRITLAWNIASQTVPGSPPVRRSDVQ